MYKHFLRYIIINICFLVSANLGGIFGLCLGGSIISIFEVVWFVLDLLFALILNVSKTKVRGRNNKKRVFVLNNDFKVKE